MKLPKGWVAVFDEASNEYFYWNQTTDMTTWEVPTEETAKGGAGGGGGGGGAAGGARSPRGGGEDGTEEDDKAGVEYAAAGKRKNRQGIMAESYDPTAGGKVEVKRVEKPDAVKDLIRKALQGGAAFLFSSLSATELETVVMAMAEKAVAPGDVVIKQGDKGDYFYVVESGAYSIFVNGTKVAARGPGDAFGELALLYNCPRAATIQADTAGRLWALDRVTFRYMVASTREGQLAEIVRGLRNVELLKALTEDQLNRAAEAVKVVSYRRGERIITKGELGNECFFVKSGKVRCFGATAAGKAMEDMYISAGGYFGERALLLGAPRAANVEADTDDVSAFVLARKEFTELLGPLKNLLEQDLIVRVLNTIPLLAALGQPERDRVIARLTTVELADKQVLAKAGSPLNTFYFVKSGTLRVVRGGKEDTMGQGVSAGPAAGRRAGPAAGARPAAGPPPFCGLGGRELGPCGAAGAPVGGPPPGGPLAAPGAVLTGGAAAAAAAAAGGAGGGGGGGGGRKVALRKEDLEVMRTLGAGTFGRVKLVRHKVRCYTHNW